MEYIHKINLLQFAIEDEGINIEIYRSFEHLLKNAILPIFTKKRLKYKHFCFNKAKKIIIAYSSIISNYDNDIIHRLKFMRKLYNYILIFITDLFKYTSRFVLNGLYISILRLINELDNNTEITTELQYLKKIIKCSMLKVINAIEYICINNINILIRLPYYIFNKITNYYDIYKIYAEYDGALLDKYVANSLNNAFKMGIIPIFIKKINIYIILYILKFLTFKELSYYDMFSTIDKINNSKQLFIKNHNLIKIVI